MEKQLFFSIVIPLYNKENYIKHTLESALNQTHKHFEIIIINDGSTDKSLDCVKTFTDSRISIITQKNKGLSSSRNLGIKKSKYDYIAFLDADDLWCEDYLETIYNMIIFDKSSSILSTGTQVIRPKQKANLAPIPFLLENVLKIPNYFKLKKNIFSPSSLVVKKEVFKKAGVFDETINYGEEEDFIIRVFSIFSLTHYHTAKVYYLKGLNDQLTSPNSKIKRVHPNYSKYLNNTNKQVLKPYIDFIYFKLVVLYKMQRNYKLVKTYKEKIDASNLSVVRKIKYHLPTNLFFILKSCYLILKK